MANFSMRPAAVASIPCYLTPPFIVLIDFAGKLQLMCIRARSLYIQWEKAYTERKTEVSQQGSLVMNRNKLYYVTHKACNFLFSFAIFSTNDFWYLYHTLLTCPYTLHSFFCRTCVFERAHCIVFIVCD